MNIERSVSYPQKTNSSNKSRIIMTTLFCKEKKTLENVKVRASHSRMNFPFSTFSISLPLHSSCRCFAKLKVTQPKPHPKHFTFIEKKLLIKVDSPSSSSNARWRWTFSRRKDLNFAEDLTRTILDNKTQPLEKSFRTFALDVIVSPFDRRWLEFVWRKSAENILFLVERKKVKT